MSSASLSVCVLGAGAFDETMCFAFSLMGPRPDPHCSWPGPVAQGPWRCSVSGLGCPGLRALVRCTGFPGSGVTFVEVIRLGGGDVWFAWAVIHLAPEAQFTQPLGQVEGRGESLGCLTAHLHGTWSRPQFEFSSRGVGMGWNSNWGHELDHGEGLAGARMPGR